MKFFFNKKMVRGILFLFILTACLCQGEEALCEQKHDRKAEITFLQGKASRIRGKVKTFLSQGGFLLQGDQVATGKNSRIEIKLPEGSYMRFDEQTHFEMESAYFDQKKRSRTIRLKLFLGKVWSKVSSFFGKSKFEISTRTVVSGVRGTTYRMNVNEDDSASIKVYGGEVAVRPVHDKVEDHFKEAAAPRPISGPYPVQGPHPVSSEEWMHILKSMQQIDIRPDGTAAKPFSFLPDQDTNQWVRWNQERDQQIK